MSRPRHFGLVAALFSPLLAAFWLISNDLALRDRLGMTLLWFVMLWIGAEFQWRRMVRPVGEVVREIGAESLDGAVWAARDMRENSLLCRDDRDRMAELLEDLSSSLGEGLIVVSPDLKLRLANQAALHFCGVEKAIRGTHLLEILREPDVVAQIREAAAGSRRDPIIIENPRGLWEIRAFPAREGGAVALVSDVGLVRKAAEFRRRFVQDLSHELRSPLAALRTAVEALDGEIDDQLVEIVVRQVERLDRLTGELYELATIESGAVELSLERIDLQSMAAEVVRDFKPEGSSARVELRVDVPVGSAVESDRRGLYRVLSNLVDNAIKYNRPGGWVEIRAERTDDEVRIEVADSGEGIPAGELQAVFQRFYRLDRARTPGRGGLGLGLAIVKHMVQYMGGRLELDSREGVGTRVSLLLPGA
jgi:signal transduction histidine kinase